MNKRLSAILMACLVSVMPIASTAPVSAQSLSPQTWQNQSMSGQVQRVGYWGGLGFGGGGHYGHGDFASGLLGFTFGTIIGGALAAPRYGYGGYGYGGYGYGGYRGYGGYGGYRGYGGYPYRGYGRGYYGRPYYANPGYRGYYGRPYYRAPRYYARNSGSHVQRCLDRYRSYDPASNTFMGYDGLRHYCRF
jgi:hypothetical protein